MIRQRIAFLWFASGFVLPTRNTVLQHFLPNVPRFLPNAPQFGETCHIFTGKVLQSLDCGALQDGAFSGIASKCDAHGGVSAAHVMPH